ncbi:ankyrin repeat-containing protein NPR4-like [Cryptomeria japonica]|uniref:ankyrin repeat-containing protein NPR4-like n=1 Tax=Cryptomeria japonica TaxID=3369 RepID=UPI0025AD296F|nr:ankyrin repeat-containing protein NPR4-like [Cryptomeria japonica]
MTPLHIASFTVIPISPPPIWFFRARKRHRDISQIFEMLIQKDRSVCYMVDKNMQNPLHLAVINGNAGLVRQILRHSKDCIDMVDIVGRNPLHLAVENASIIFARAGPGIRDIMLDVLKKRFINCTDSFGRTPIDIVKDYSCKDPRLFYAIGNFLSKCGGRPSSRWLQSEARNFPTSEISTWKGQTISVNAVLLATVAFTVAFTLPGKHDSADINSLIFKVLVVSDALAFCFSMASGLVLVYASFSSNVEDPILCDKSLFALWVALVSTGLTFGAAIHMVVAPKCLWLAMVMWVMVSYLPIWLVRLSSRGKLFLFTHPTAFIVDLISAAVSLLYFLCDPLHELVTVLVDVIDFIRFSLRRCVKGKSPIISSKRSYSSSAMEGCTDFLSKKPGRHGEGLPLLIALFFYQKLWGTVHMFPPVSGAYAPGGTSPLETSISGPRLGVLSSEVNAAVGPHPMCFGTFDSLGPLKDLFCGAL